MIRQAGCRNTVTEQRSVRLNDAAADRHLLSRQGQFLGGWRGHGARSFRRDVVEDRGLDLGFLLLRALRALQALGRGLQAVGALARRRRSLSHRGAFGADGVLREQRRTGGLRLQMWSELSTEMEPCEASWTQTFDSVVSAQEESDSDLFEVDAAMPLASPPCFLSPSVLPVPLLEGVGVLLRDCAWLWGEGFLIFLKGSSITVGPPGGFGGPPEDDVQLETLGCG